jgi:branched-chain amino acid transport system substrate-binding protein
MHSMISSKSTLSFRSQLIASALALSALFGCTNQSPSRSTASTHDGDANSPSEIVIGQVASMTGNEATFGVSTDHGVKMAIDEINSTGGIKGKKLRLVTLDDQGKPEQAAMAITRVITRDHAVAVLGEFLSSASIAMGPIAQRYKTPMVSSGATNPRVTQAGNFVFRTSFIDPFQGSVMAKFALGTLHAKKIAVLRDAGNDYSVGLADFFTKTFQEGGGTIVTDQSYATGDFDFKGQLTSIRAQKPDAIFVPGNYGEVALIMRQKKELGIDVPLLGGDGWDSPKLQEVAGAGFEGNYFSNHYSPDNTAPNVVKFVGAYKKLYAGEVPTSMAALGYDAAGVLADAMRRAKTLSNEDIRDALASTKDYAGVTGQITIDKNRNAVKSAVILKTTGNKYAFAATVNP